MEPDNCLIMKDGYVKLADMGLSKVLPYTLDVQDGQRAACNLAFTMCGTPEFLAPEYIFSRGYDRRMIAVSIGGLLGAWYMRCFLG
jgi:serine/threonine protein kinase